MRVFVPSRRRERNAITTTAHLAQRYRPADAVSTGRAGNRGKFVHAFSSHPVPLIPLLRVPSQPCTPFLRCLACRCFGQKKCHVAWQSNNQQIYDGLGAPVTKSVLSGYNLHAPVVVLPSAASRHFPFALRTVMLQRYGRTRRVSVRRRPSRRLSFVSAAEGGVPCQLQRHTVRIWTDVVWQDIHAYGVAD